MKTVPEGGGSGGVGATFLFVSNECPEIILKTKISFGKVEQQEMKDCAKVT